MILRRKPKFVFSSAVQWDGNAKQNGTAFGRRVPVPVPKPVPNLAPRLASVPEDDDGADDMVGGGRIDGSERVVVTHARATQSAPAALVAPPIPKSGGTSAASTLIELRQTSEKTFGNDRFIFYQPVHINGHDVHVFYLISHTARRRSMASSGSSEDDGEDATEGNDNEGSKGEDNAARMNETDLFEEMENDRDCEQSEQVPKSGYQVLIYSDGKIVLPLSGNKLFSSRDLLCEHVCSVVHNSFLRCRPASGATGQLTRRALTRGPGTSSGTRRQRGRTLEVSIPVHPCDSFLHASCRHRLRVNRGYGYDENPTEYTLPHEPTQ